MPMPSRQQFKRMFQWDFISPLIFISSICSVCVITTEKNLGMFASCLRTVCFSVKENVLKLLFVLINTMCIIL